MEKLVAMEGYEDFADTSVWHVYHSSPRASLVGMRETPGMVIVDQSGRRGYY